METDDARPPDPNAPEESIDPADVNHGQPPDTFDDPALQSEEDATPLQEGDLGMPEGPPDDEEMPLADHIEEMVLRLAIVCAVAAVAAGTVFFYEPLAEDIILFIWQSVLPESQEAATNPRVYGPLELKLAELKFASLVGFVLALPVFVYETYRFMRPGLYPNERRYYLAAVPTSLVLALVGVSFAYFIVLPAIFEYFVRYSSAEGQLGLAFALSQTFDLILVLMGYLALVFQIPLFIMLAIMMGLTSRRWLEGRRLYFWGGFLGVSFLFVPEPTGMAPIIVALTMIGLFEGTLALLRWTGN
jgi:sec-independent protein translocase protein TatC